MFIFFLLFTSCTKFGKNITIEGRVLNPITGEGIEGAKLKLLKSKVFALSGGYKEITEAITNSNGEFEVNKFRLRAEVLRAQDLNGDYYAIGWTSDNGLTFITQNSSDLVVTKGKKQKADFWAVPYGEILTGLHNVNCQGVNDTLIFERIYLLDQSKPIFLPATLTGCYNNNGAFAKVPCGDYLLKWKVIRSSVETNFTHTVTVPANGQVSYNIDY